LHGCTLHRVFSSDPAYVIDEEGIELESFFLQKRRIRWVDIENVELRDYAPWDRPIGSSGTYGEPMIRVVLKRRSPWNRALLLIAGEVNVPSADVFALVKSNFQKSRLPPFSRPGSGTLS
jgi:Bacterial PH domain